MTSEPAQILADCSISCIPQHEPTAWLREQVQGILRRFVNGRIRTCPHPGQRLISLWSPDRLRCFTCEAAFQLDRAATDDDDYSCDRCGHIVTGDETLIGIGYTATDRIIVVTGLCQTCSAKETPGAEA